jgi:hypothetical protein
MGTGSAEFEAWRVVIAWEVAGDSEAAAAPVMTRQMASERIASFIVGNPF